MQTKDNAIVFGDAVQLASQIVAAYASKNTLKADEIPEVLQTVYEAVSGLAGDPIYAGAREPAVPVNKSITPDYIVCLEDGKKLKMLKRYLRTHYNLSPDDYRRKWGLPSDYPMTAPNYAKRRSRLAKEIGLGTGAAAAKQRAKRKRRKRKAR